MAHHPSGSGKHAEDLSPAEVTRPRRRAEQGEELKGLCVNCANRSVCLLPKSEGGVWHCQEYVEEKYATSKRDCDGY